MFENVKVKEEHEEKWGRLVRTWVTGNSEFPADIPATRLTPPKDLTDLKEQCVLVGIEISIPARITGLVVTQQGPETLLLRLPSKKMVEEALARPPGQYKIPAFYQLYCGPLSIPAGQEEKFQALRIGDYTLGTCK